jgi:hypothetical protein
MVVSNDVRKKTEKVGKKDEALIRQIKPTYK